MVRVLVDQGRALFEAVEAGADGGGGVVFLAVFWSVRLFVVGWLVVVGFFFLVGVVGLTYEVEMSPRKAFSFAMSGGLKVLCAPA